MSRNREPRLHTPVPTRSHTRSFWNEGALLAAVIVGFAASVFYVWYTRLETSSGLARLPGLIVVPSASSSLEPPPRLSGTTPVPTRSVTTTTTAAVPPTVLPTRSPRPTRPIEPPPPPQPTYTAQPKVRPPPPPSAEDLAGIDAAAVAPFGLSVDDVGRIRQAQRLGTLPAELTPDQASKLIRKYKMAVVGETTAMFELATMLELGIGAPRDPVSAAHWYQLAASLGHDPSSERLQVLARKGITPRPEAAGGGR